jgi:hypothetical protein
MSYSNRVLGYLFAYSGQFSTLKMNVVRCYETSANCYAAIHFIPVDNTVHRHHTDKLKCNTNK